MTKGANLTDRRIRTLGEMEGLTFHEDGLLPVVAQDADTREVLTVAWANRAALGRTLESGQMHYWSRSRQELWHKGATSGNTQSVVSLHADCDADTVLALVRPRGPACHTDERTCFGKLSPEEEGRGEPPTSAEAPGRAPEGEAAPESVLPALWSVLESRARELPEGSYTARLLRDENLRLKKLGEETAELILALGRGEGEGAASEAADLLYHLLVALLASGITLDELLAELDERRR